VDVQPDSYAARTYEARLEVDYPERLDRVTSVFRLIWIIPISIVLTTLLAVANETVTRVSGDVVTTTTRSGGGISGGLFAATVLMILFRQRYPRWWFDFAREFVRFEARVAAYLFLLTDRYPSTVEEQSVHLEIDYPDVERDLNRWLPLVKWFLAIPHYIVLVCLRWAGLSSGSSPGSPSCSPDAIHAHYSTTWWASAGGGCASRRTRSCWSRIGIHRSAFGNLGAPEATRHADVQAKPEERPYRIGAPLGGRSVWPRYSRQFRMAFRCLTAAGARCCVLDNLSGDRVVARLGSVTL
jgi:hypothetical protein